MSASLLYNRHTSRIPNAVVTTLTIKDGRSISAGLTLPAAARMLITVDGKSSMPVEFITNSIAIPLVILTSPLSISSIALIAVGVAAFATPMRLALMFTTS